VLECVLHGDISWFWLFLAALTCSNDFEGGGWALVRRVKKGSVWHAAKDNLKGTASYGTKNARITDDSSFSIPYVTNVWVGTEFLFMIGMVDDGLFDSIPLTVFASTFATTTGTGAKYLITTWDSINNGGAFYTGLDRSASKSSASSSACKPNALCFVFASSFTCVLV
jgi:hypothetical protein